MGPFVNAACKEKVSEGLINGFLLRVPLDGGADHFFFDKISEFL